MVPDDQSCSLAGDTHHKQRPVVADETRWRMLRAVRQPHLAAHRDTLGRALSLMPGRQRPVLPRLPTLPSPGNGEKGSQISSACNTTLNATIASKRRKGSPLPCEREIFTPTPLSQPKASVALRPGFSSNSNRSRNYPRQSKSSSSICSMRCWHKTRRPERTNPAEAGFVVIKSGEIHSDPFIYRRATVESLNN